MNEFGNTQEEPGAAREQIPLSKEEQAQISSIKDLEAEFIRLCQGMGNSRDLSLAITYVENAALRAINHVHSKRKAK